MGMATAGGLAPCVLGALLAAAPASAQVRVSMQWLYPVETLFVSDFAPYGTGQQPDFLSVNLQNGAGEQTIVLEVSVAQEHPLAQLVFRGSTAPFVLREPLRRVTNRDLASEGRDVSIEDYEIGDDTDRITETGRFPSGRYVFAARVLTPQGIELDRSEVRVDLVNPTRVELLTPGTPFGDPPPVVATPSPRFQWTPDEGLVAAGAEYRLRVVPVNGAASPEEAIQGFAAWEATTSATSALYPGSVTALPLQPGGTYAWQVIRRVRTSGGSEDIASEIYWFRMADATAGGGAAGPGDAASIPADLLLRQLAERLGMGDDLEGFRPTGQILVDGEPVSTEGLEALIRAILAGEISVHSITVR